jgi:hypothetical protein
MPWLIQTIVTIGLRYRTLLLTTLLISSIFDFGSFADDEKHDIVRGATFQHPIYLALQEGAEGQTIRGIPDRSTPPAIMYIVRLEPGQELSAQLTSMFDKSRGLEPFLLYLFDAKTTSLVGSSTNWIIQTRGTPEPPKTPTIFRASFRFASPVANDYYIVPVFESAGVVFSLNVKVKKVITIPLQLSCETGSPSKPIYLSPGNPDSLIADITIDDNATANRPDEHKRRFCVAQACKTRPPTSLFLTKRLRAAFEGKNKVKACWDSSNTISEITVVL